ncbi:MAG: RNA polymerase sigma factor [Candidatus Dojkabacteria bacterium]|nr:MAG: RNA polymerase sigma factor [Candidatus Dojkabacteria bacterium]
MDAPFVKLYEKLKVKLYTYVYFKVRNASVAEDITSEAFLRLFKAWKESKEVADYAQAWAYRTAYNLIIDHVRSAHYKKSKTMSEIEKKNADKTDDESFEVDFADDKIKDYLENEIKDEQISQLHEALADLKQIEREIIELRIFQELPFAEIAVILDIAEGAAKMRYKRSIDKLGFIVSSQKEKHKADNPKSKKKRDELV